MGRKVLPLLLLLFCSATVIAQKGKISGIIKDELTSETLIGATVLIGSGVGTTTDIDGYFEIEADYGEYDLTVSYVGYESKSQKVTLDKKEVTVKFSLGITTLNEFEVVADIAVDRETPIAFTNILPATIEEELAAQDLPMILNSTPGVYATQQGGGDGDARVSIRGFSQRNVAVMIDGIPVNDMENGQVYWSNWFGLDAVTRTMQVQRGLGASKIAIPSIGGTINILTKGIDAKKGGMVKQEIGNNGFLRTSLGLSTGPLKGGWGLTVAGSYKQGNGWVEQAFTKGGFYYLKAEKKLGKHLLALAAMGAPQSHGQRSFKKPLPLYDIDFALSEGFDTANHKDDINPSIDLGANYNQHWGEYETYRVNEVGDTTRGESVLLNERVNYYHKPQFSLRDFWSVNEKLYISNILYVSIGRGGGVGSKNTITDYDLLPNGQIDWQTSYDNNVGNNRFDNAFGQEIDVSIDRYFSDTEHKSSRILYAGVNNHNWFGGLSTFQYVANESWTYSGGIDARSYRGIHYREVYDLIGGDYYGSPTDEGDENTERGMLRVGDKFFYHNEGLVRWGGLFGQAEYSSTLISAFVNISSALSAYKRIDYFNEKDIVIGDQVFARASDEGGVFFYNSDGGLSAYNGATITYSGDTIFVNNNPNIYNPIDSFIVGAMDSIYNDDQETRYNETAWKYIPGFTVKGGFNYKLNEFQNIFINSGYISKAQRFQNVIDNDNEFYEQVENEKIIALELGWGLRKKKYAMNLNAYTTSWKNKPQTATVNHPDDDEVRIPVNLNGLNALHRGAELDFAYNVTPRLTVEGVISVGDWKWTSKGNSIVNDPATGVPIDTFEFNAENLHVGDAAQTQLGAMLRYQLVSNKKVKSYVKARYTYFDRHYSDFNPVDYQENDTIFEANFNDNGSPRQSWIVPSYGLLDVHVGISFKLNNGMGLHLKGSMLNALDQKYISDAKNNDTFTYYGSDTGFDVNSAAVFVGQGRRFNTSLKITF
jgi:iron complex outermembrane receptor protein